MSVDQALLESTSNTGKSVLRLYRWQPATLSLGYFQRTADRDTHTESRNCPVVRRASGGGAIIHHHELTYSLCGPVENRWSEKHTQLYRTVHGCLVSCLSDWSIQVEPFAGAASSRRESPQDFLCFQRRFTGDLIMGEHKVVGSAQRRGRNAILQHGSILLGRSEFAPQLPGINDLASHRVDELELAESFANKLFVALSVAGSKDRLTPHESELANRILTGRFANDDWNQRLRGREKNALDLTLKWDER